MKKLTAITLGLLAMLQLPVKAETQAPIVYGGIGPLATNDKVEYIGDEIVLEGVGQYGWLTALVNYNNIYHITFNINSSYSGVGGDTSATMLARLSAALTAKHPTVVVLMVGRNDARNQVTPLAFYNNMLAAVTQAKAFPGVRKVIVVSPISLGDHFAYNPGNNFDTYLDYYEGALFDIQKNTGAAVLNERELFKQGEFAYNHGNFAHGILVDANGNLTVLGNQLFLGGLLTGFGE